MKRLLLFIIIIIALHGCSTTLDQTYIVRSYVKERWLGYLMEGAEKQEIAERLGSPTRSYYDGNLLAYRLVLMADGAIGEKLCRNYNDMAEPLLVNQRRRKIPEKGELVVVREGMKDGWRVLCSEAEYHLVIVFGEDGKVEKYSFLEIFPK
jgi:hypothetical protein